MPARDFPGVPGSEYTSIVAACIRVCTATRRAPRIEVDHKWVICDLELRIHRRSINKDHAVLIDMAVTGVIVTETMNLQI